MIEVVSAFAVVALAVPVDAQERMELRVSAHIPLSPFAHVTYELKHVGNNTAVALTRFHADDYGSDSEVELVGSEAYALALEETEPCLSEPNGTEEPASSDVPWLDVRGTRGTTEVRTILRADTDPEAHDQCLAALRSVARGTLRVDEYQMPYWDDGEFGTLRATANLPARVYVDGRPTGLITPVNGLRLEPGVHEVRWVAIVTGREVVQSVTIVTDMTTQVSGTFEEPLETEPEG